jgi:phosphate/sulfate permease
MNTHNPLCLDFRLFVKKKLIFFYQKRKQIFIRRKGYTWEEQKPKVESVISVVIKNEATSVAIAHGSDDGETLDSITAAKIG